MGKGLEILQVKFRMTRYDMKLDVVARNLEFMSIYPFTFVGSSRTFA